MFSIIKTCVLCTFILNHAISIKANTNNPHVENLVSLLREKGGILNSKVDLTTTGLYAKQNIPKNELLLKIPSAYLLIGGLPKVGDNVYHVNENYNGEEILATITSVNPNFTFDVRYETTNNEGFQIDYKFIKNINGDTIECNAVRALLDEIKLGSESDYVSYLNYLSSQNNTTKIPRDWSEAGKSLLLEVLGDQLPPYNLETKWETECYNNIAEQLEKMETKKIKIPPIWKNIFIPFFDIIKHHNNGILANAIIRVDLNSGVTFHASRDINTEEEISIPYTHCTDCKERNIEYGTTSNIFRDFGIVEEYPQRWFFTKHSIAFEIYNVNEKSELKWIQTGLRESYKVLKGELDRLLALQETTFSSLYENVPESEWNTINQYTHALIKAIEQATTTNLAFECNDDYDFDEYKELETIETPYQVMSFKHDANKNDTCLYLGGIGQNRSDDVLQQCENYRPHYHEIFVHYAAKFVDEVKRVAWVGGGDSMLLNEILKYPSLELVIGLEIDQTVTRKSFQYFGTQPHWHNEKVKWWYGDAAKSLLVIPKEYYGTFDMVLVDLSETVLSMTVCKKLDIMSALGLLLKPDGVLVKNDEYFQQLTKVFDYTIQVEVDIPVPNPYVCILPIILASNKIDFLAGFRKDHNIDTLWPNHYSGPMSHNIWFDYRKNSTQSMTCQEQLDIENELISESKSPGILMILEAESVAIDISQSKEFVKLLETTLKNEGLNIMKVFMTTPNKANKKMQIVILFHEGYVVARTWPSLKYCAFDIHLWSRFEKHDSIKKSLLEAVGSEQISSYRIVAGGLYGMSTWDEDMKARGPRFTQPCDSEVEDSKSSPTTCDNYDLIDFVTEKTLSIIPDDSYKVVVVCGEENQKCSSLDVVRNDKRKVDVLELRSCSDTMDVNTCTKNIFRILQRFTTWSRDSLTSKSDVQDSNGFKIGERIKRKLAQYGRVYFGIIHYIKSDGTLDILYDNGTFEYNAEVETVTRLNEEDILIEKSKLRAIIIDSSATFNMGLILHNIFMSVENRENILSHNIMMMALNQDHNANWRGLLHSLHNKMFDTDDAVFLAHVLFHKADIALDLSITSSGDSFFTERLKSVTSDINDSPSGLVSDIRQIYRQEVVKHTNTAERFYPNDYDIVSSSAQWKSQKATGRQTIFQLEQFETETRMLELTDIVNEGEIVEVYYEEMDNWYTGTVVSIDEEDYFYIKFIDGDESDEIERDQIRKTFIKSSNEPLSTSIISNAVRVICNDMPDIESYNFLKIGDGSIENYFWAEGGVIVLWDGKSHVDINLFTYNEDKDFHSNFVQKFEMEIPSLNVALHDTQPRGIGRVINFSKDIKPHVKPLWIQAQNL